MQGQHCLLRMARIRLSLSQAQCLFTKKLCLKLRCMLLLLSELRLQNGLAESFPFHVCKYLNILDEFQEHIILLFLALGLVCSLYIQEMITNFPPALRVQDEGYVPCLIFMMLYIPFPLLFPLM